MEAAIDRRITEAPRVSLDVLIELSHEDFEEPFEAEGVNLGTGGLAMRAAYLPDVGERLLCRFATEGERVEADCEVVWAQDSGPHVGEFGLRFVGLDADDHARILRTVASADGPATQPGLQPPEADKPAEALARLFIEGVATPIVARIQHCADDCMVVEQELPFLRVGKRVAVDDQAGPRARIESVDLRIEQDMPRLVLGIVYESDAGTTSSGQASIPAAVDADATVNDFELPAELREEVTSDAPVVVAPHSPRTERAHDTPVVFHTPVRESSAAEVAPAPVEVGDHDPLAAALVRRGVDLAPQLARARALLQTGWARLSPLWATLTGAVGRLSARARERGGPALEEGLGHTRAVLSRFVLVLRERVGSRVPALAPKPRRRATAPAPAAPASRAARPRRRQNSEAVVTPAPRRRRVLLVGLVAAVAVGFAVYAFATPRAPAIPVRHAASTAGVSQAASTVPAAVPSPELGDVQPANALPVHVGPLATPNVQPPMPTALPAPSRQAGRMPAPTYPTLAAAQPAGPRRMPSGSPYGVDVRGEGVAGHDPTLHSVHVPSAAPAPRAGGTTFGDGAVPHARRFVLRMSHPVTHLRGVADVNGFSVAIAGSLSLDRAGPIAASLASVDKAMILNRGDHAELTVHFADGHRPAYRVTAKGAAVEVLIGR